MTTLKRYDIKIPSTRYKGSKRKIVDWIWNNIDDLKFDSFLDALGGTGSISFQAKLHGKKVTYNDVFRSNCQVGLALIENNFIVLTTEDINFLLKKHRDIEYQTFIQDTYQGIYYTDEENRWLDMFICNLQKFEDFYKQAIAISALFQSCIAKRPFGLFHRANLYMRLANVKRGFGSKVTWDKSFPDHFKNFVEEYNSCIFQNGRNNKVLNLDVFDIPYPEEYDLVYIDTPYFSKMKGSIDYYFFYHFLEGLIIYLKEGPTTWNELIDYSKKPKPLKHKTDLERSNLVWMEKNKIYDNFDKLFRKFRKSNLIVSYNSEGIPLENEMIDILRRYKTDVLVKHIKYRYAINSSKLDELLFIGI